MSRSPSRTAIRVFRIASLIIPPAVALRVAFSAPHATELGEAVVHTLAPLGLATMAALAFRTLDALLERNRAALREDAGDSSLLDGVDVLTASGSALAWTSAAAIVLSVCVGWASLALVGVMGTALLNLVVIWTCIRTAGGDPARRASASRRFVPARVVEGDPVAEELRFVGLRVPIGFRLFASGRVGPRWPLCRYVVDDDASGGEVVLEREIGPARRGEHQAPPLELWLEDVFGLCRTPRVRAAAARLTVLPRPRSLGKATPMLAAAGADREPRPATLLPTEGTFRLREYQPGDDARRIHWVRSLVARELVVRMPDEIPPDRPAVDVVLDTFLPGVDALRCDAPAELLDALVSVWLGVGAALARGGAKVTLITAAAGEDGRVGAVRLRSTRNDQAAPLRLGARVAWQPTLPVRELTRTTPTVVVSCRLQHEIEGHAASRWILVPEAVWTCFEDVPPAPARLQFPHPIGSADNRGSRRRQARRRFDRALREHGNFAGLAANVAPPRPGTFVARPAAAHHLRLEELA